MNSNMMTILGAVGAMLAYAVLSAPEGTPKYLLWLIGSINAGISVYVGITNKGTATPSKIDLTTEKK